MSVADPDDLHRIFAARANAGDLEGMVALYEDAAAFVEPDGTIATGGEAIREHLLGVLALSPEITPIDSKCVIAGDIALLSNHWRMTVGAGDGQRAELEGTSMEVARRKPDAGWRYVIDDPSSSTSAIGADAASGA
jgi:ketosteroid isomerase-like protein